MDRESYQLVKEEIKRSADIVDLVGNFVQLRKAGRNYVGLCPFHSEKEPSFTVNRERQMFHCFGCKKGGDIFAFWMAYHHCSFPEAVKDLAERYHVPLPEKPLSAEEKRKRALREAILAVNEKAARYFHGNLMDSPGAEGARNYLHNRGIPVEVIRQFKLGYAFDQWEGLVGYLERGKVDRKIAESAGLIILGKKGRYYDRFRGRVIFPIFDLSGRVVGFGGRVLDEGHPKYLNTPETQVFQKGSVLYGLNASYPEIRKTRKALIVEGYMDFLALWIAGIRNIGATLGTALTPSHVRRLKGYASEIVLVFDSDEAGREAALRGLPVFLNEGVQGKAVLLPPGHDPDTFVKAEGPERFLELVEGAPSLLDFYMNQRLSDNRATVEEKVSVLKELLPCLYEVKDPTLRAGYVRRVSEAVGIKESVVWEELDRFRKKDGGQIQGRLRNKASEESAAKRYNRDLHILNLLIHHPETRAQLAECEWQPLLTDATIGTVIEAFLDKYKREGQFEPQDLVEELEDERARNEYREALLLPSFYSASSARVAVEEIKNKIREIKITSSIRDARRRGDMEELNALLKLRAKLHQGLMQ
ncbi:MAG: DNA primase [Deltaproteobacteria bacterium]|nr:DNA primase [Deltaproteobacteria bacterium]MBW1928947.1 DNA primase [Deltaproteobacteria bacterium]MBW2024490.1 DNA primase [Deltaproteobacteria bacterium]MBW2125129.1 DNA primase [Deltaproteobacteria bacterium]RLB21958.1 MAG: DNA primase [Deltaproteobacteria bacterium]